MNGIDILNRIGRKTEFSRNPDLIRIGNTNHSKNDEKVLYFERKYFEYLIENYGGYSKIIAESDKCGEDYPLDIKLFKLFHFGKVDKFEFNVGYRSDLEDNLDCVQIVVCGLLYDTKGNILLLRNIKGDMLHFKTMVQGHCNPISEDSGLLHILEKNMEREFYEEIYCKKRILYTDTFNVQLGYMICAPTITYGYLDNISFYHVGFVYTIEVDDVYQFTTNEPEKNEVVIINKNDKISQMELCSLDSWIRVIYRKIINMK